MKEMKRSKVLAIILALAMVIVFAVGCGGGGDDAGSVTPPPADSGSAAVEPAGDAEAKTIGFYADAADSYYSLMNDVLGLCAAQDPECNWTIDYRAGSSTAEEQLTAVEDFITNQYDAIIVIQNSPETTSECIEKAKAANIPYFGAAHDFSLVANAGDSTGSTAYDFEYGGVLAGEDAIARGVSKVIMIEGVLGQGSAAAQSLGFLKAYEEAGMSLGEKADGTPWTAVEIATDKPQVADILGNPEITVVQWASGDWMAEPAQTAMTNAITALGADGWDGAYVQNNPMVEGAINAMTDAGMSTDDYWLASMNGREISWGWAQEGAISMDVNQPSSLEGVLLYQMLKEYFATGAVTKAHVRPYLTPYTKEDIADKIANNELVPATEVQNFMDGMNAGTFVWKIDDAKFVEIEAENW